MSQFPRITSNPNESQFNLPSVGDAGDGGFDIYVFEEDDGVQVAFLVFVVKNTNDNATSELIINSMTGNADFNAHFTLSPVDGSGNLHIGRAAENFIKPSIGDCNVTGLSSSTDASDAVGFIGYTLGGTTDADDQPDFSLNQHAQELNASGSTHCLPLYKTDATTNSIVGSTNAIPAESYAAFVVKFHPQVQINQNSLDPKLTIVNNSNNQVISFNIAVTNLLTYFGKIGTGANGSPDSWSATSGDLTDGGTFNLGVYPVDYVYPETGKTIKFDDNSTTPGEYFYDFGFEGITQGGNYDLNQDGATISPVGSSAVISKFRNSWKHPNETFTNEDNCAGDNPTAINTNINPITALNVELYKNYSLGANSTIHQEQTNFDFASASDNTRWTANNHISVSDITVTATQLIGKIFNAEYPTQTADGSNNQYFKWLTSIAYYNVVSMHPNQTAIHKASDDSYSPTNDLARYINIGTQANGTKGPYLQNSSSNVHGMQRGDTLSVNVHFRYNYLAQAGETDSSFFVNGGSTFSLTSDYVKLYSNMGSSTPGGGNSPTGNVSASSYNTSEYSSVIGSFTGTPATGVDFAGFTSAGGNGDFLGLRFPLGTIGMQEHILYTDDGAGSVVVRNEIGWREKVWGIFEGYYKPANAGSNTLWDYLRRGGQDDSHGPRYRFAFRPKPSRLELLSSENILDAPVNKLFFDYPTYQDTTEYSTISEKKQATQWYKHGTTQTATGAILDASITDANLAANEGKWYGSAGTSVVRPHCWNGGNSSTPARDESLGDTDNGAYFTQAPTNRTILTSTNADAPEYQETTCMDYFKIPDATYNSNVQKYRSAGRFYFKNTGDYPIYIQKVEVGTADFTPDGGNTFCDDIANMLVPTSNAKYLPVITGSESTSSNDPEWKVDFSGSPVWGSTGGVGIHGTNAASYKVFPDNMSGTSATGKVHYYENNPTSTTFSSRKRMFIPPMFNDTSVVDITGSDSNFVDISFNLDPENDSALDTGKYYTQVVISYYVDDYKNRKNPTESETDSSHTTLSLADSSNTQSRLHISKYLIECEVTAVADIILVDVETDSLESSPTITIPTLTVQ